MTAFISDYISYIQESRLKSETLSYHEMNQYFWHNIDSSHWREKRANFYRNHDLILNKLDDDVEATWIKQAKNFIARDNLLHYLAKVDSQWIEVNMDTQGFEPVACSLTRSKPVVFLTFHNFYQVLIPTVLAQYLGPVSSFVLDEEAESDGLVRTYLSELYKGMEQGLNGGSLLKVGAGRTYAAKLKVNEILEQKGNVYAAIDMVHPLLGSKTKVTLKTDFFEMDVLAGIIDIGLSKEAQFALPFISLARDGKLRLEMFTLSGSSTEEILASFQKVFDSIILKDISVWEGASLLSYKEGKFS
jgi:hypothetical protein